MSNWIAYHRSEEADELQTRHPNAFLLLAQIARRARWKDCPITGLTAGQALVGDWKKAGIPSEMAYRHAKEILVKTNLATFQGTTRGTIATLVSTSVFSLSVGDNNGRSNGPGNDQATDEERTSNDQATTNVQGYKGTPSKRKQRTGKQPKPDVSDGDFIESLKADPNNAGVDIERELAKAAAWIASVKNTKGTPFSQRFVANWMKRVDRTLSLNLPKPAELGPTDRVGDRQGSFEVIES